MSEHDCAMGEVQSTCNAFIAGCRRVLALDHKECRLLSQLNGNIAHLRSQLSDNRNTPKGKIISGMVRLVDRFGRRKKG